MNQIAALIVDDRVILRKGLRMLLAQEVDIQIAGEVTDGLQVLSLAEREQEVLRWVVASSITSRLSVS